MSAQGAGPVSLEQWLTELAAAVRRITHISGGDPDLLVVPVVIGVAFMFSGVLKALGLFWGPQSARAGLLLVAGGLAIVALGSYLVLSLLPGRPFALTGVGW